MMFFLCHGADRSNLNKFVSIGSELNGNNTYTLVLT